MRKAEIHINGVYAGKSGRLRQVLDMGPQYKLYEGQECEDNLRYVVVGGNKNGMFGRQGNMTVAAFAAWAKEEVTLEGRHE